MILNIARRMRKPLTNIRGVIDLASILVGVLVAGIVAAGVLASVFVVVPWAQDESAKGELNAVRTAQSVAQVMDDRYLHGAGLIAADYLPDGAEDRLTVATDDAGTCFVAGVLSATGTAFYLTNQSTKPTTTKPTECADVELGGPAPAAMVTTWDTTLGGSDTITLPLHGALDAVIDWGDGTEEPAIEFATHTYSSTGVKSITIEGTFEGWGAGDDAWTPASLTGVPEWGETETTDLSYGFQGANNLLAVSEIPSSVTNLGWTLSWTDSFNGDISNWDTSNVTDMSEMFYRATNFNGDISNWDTSNVTNMGFMFSWATNFNGDISNWDTSNVTNMGYMFHRATNFNGDISNWDTSNVTNMGYMFHRAISFDSDISSWDTSSVTNMDWTFNYALFNQDISGWDVANVTSHSEFRTDGLLTAEHSPFG